MDKKYPYLGVTETNGKRYVVLFTENSHGVVVMSETDDEGTRFGVTGDFDEDVFEYLPEDQCVRLSN